jgi:hypothetical protein
LTVISSLIQHFFPHSFQTVQKRLHRCSATAHLALVSPHVIVFRQPKVKVNLKLIKGLVYLPSECDLIKLIEDGAMESLANPVSLC